MSGVVRREGGVSGLLASMRTTAERPPECLMKLSTMLGEVDENVEGTCSLACAVSMRIHKLDTVRERLSATTKKIDDIINLKKCIEESRSAMETGDLMFTANTLVHYSSMLSDGVLDDHSISMLKDLEKDFKKLLETELLDAKKEQNGTKIKSICKIYSTLGMSDQALTVYAQHLTAKCSSTAATLLKNIKKRGSKEEQILVSEAVTEYLEEVAAVAEDQISGGINEPLGFGSILYILNVVQQQSDTSISQFLDYFTSENSLHKKVSDANTFLKSVNSQQQLQQLLPIEPALLDEIAMIIQGMVLFDNFLRAKEKAASDLIQREQSRATATSTRWVPPPNFKLKQDSDLNKRAHDLVSTYLVLEELFMVQGTLRVFHDDVSLGDALDSIFFLLQRSVMRCMLTCSADCVCAISNHLVSILNRDVLQYLLQSQSETTQRFLSASKDLTKFCQAYSVTANGMEQSVVNIGRLHSNLTSECQKLFKSNSAWPKIQLCLEDMQATTKTFSSRLRESLQQLCTSQILPRVRPLLDSFQGVVYELGEEDYSRACDSNEAFVMQFFSSLDTLLKIYCVSMSEGNYSTIIELVASYTSDRLEQILPSKRFTQIGALLFDKDVRQINSTFNKLSIRGTRDRFSRLTQIAMLLNLEKAQDVMDYWGPRASATSGVSCTLTSREVKRVLALRIDFSPSSVDSLSL